MIRMTLAEIAAAVGGTLSEADPEATATGPVEYDTRRDLTGGLFVAFPGANVDGHDFAARAVADGAVAVLGSRAVAGVPMILVDDALTAIGRLARAVLDRLPQLTVIGITGSSGKTSTKDMIGQLLARLGPTVAPPGTFNNELGLPHTALMADEQTRFLVLEMGARGPGHLTYLCGIAPPKIGVVINVGVAHIGEFGSQDKIAEAKGELVEALPADGVAVLNFDDHRVAAMASRTRAQVVGVGTSDQSVVRAEDVTLDGLGRPAYKLIWPEGETAVTLTVAGAHQVGNSLAAAAVARAAGMSVTECGEGLSTLRAVSSRRMDVFDRADGVTVIDDSYNANPASTAAALRALAALGNAPDGPARRTVAVLGYHAELGEHERSGHEEVGRTAAETGVSLLVVVGDNAAPIRDGATAVARWGGDSVLVSDQDAAVALLGERLRPGDVVLVKGSRYRTWQVVDALRAVTA
ncbi:MAG: UDP-N-acetylmuramoyl-tripeptide--D-alanyl-D-alanine ligase [Hamadaea sp.]|uniref:UDP-N-acetylmuramoyl-tripeptide--D-alanyl-D- alanine ligase n=1 Tax=Hamadaea sp. TaxID=2024425 RepID=UPI0017B3F76D|nr:UDP-N-acetylmuramoyl-tripeptide--D-alanyl-D-alanine ligase [Hamadaea sp.]NUR72658.1 UDP-N-acetylmuramoyl-tripeptide--D-alanyl-D-alanine ligase [Hamadaea sp.]NUT21663.1 UDP-N-acetylmuramoyl-tripeptide--D-alanyl-D-alanine ligase [Hamadaea sp.]